MPDCAVIIDKPEGLTSHDVVYRLRKILNTKKIGHTGTLDPFATGVLVMLVGKATRLARFVDSGVKEYEAVVRFGFETDTGDRTGTLRQGSGQRIAPDEPDESSLRKGLARFAGEIEQVPPMYSAKKVKGKKLYEFARAGVEIDRAPVKVRIHELELVGAVTRKGETSDFKLRIVCSAGTYVRTLAEDIGREIGIGCHLAELRRTKAGRFGLNAANTLEELDERVRAGKIGSVIIPMAEAVSNLATVNVNSPQRMRVADGMRLETVVEGVDDGAAVRIIDEERRLVAIGIYDEAAGQIQPRVVVV